MDIVMFFIFLVTDLFMILICMFYYGKIEKYSAGMILGVHIPREEVENADVQDICNKSRKAWKLFNRINLAAGILVCFFCLLGVEIFLVIWLVWLVEYIGGMEYLTIVPHRKMYRLKVANQWMDTKTARMAYIDTAVSVMAEQMAVSWQWHIPVLLLVAVTGILPGMKTFLTDESGFRYLYFMTLGISMLFLFLHVRLTKRSHTVYSKDTDINYAVNRMIKRAWSLTLLGASSFNGIAWCFLVFEAVRNKWLSGMDYGIYCIIQAAAALFFLTVIQAYRKKDEILSGDREALYVDDDEYWKDGWYNNPNDKRIVVQNRMNTMNYTFNMGRPAGRAICIGLFIFTAAVILWVVVIMLRFHYVRVIFTYSDTHAQFEAAGYKCSFDLSEIESAELLTEMPEEGFIKTNGGATDDYSIGYFTGRESGKCMLFLTEDCKPILKVTLPDMVIFANSEESGEVKEWYRILRQENL
ncbi:MAG: hypothetical protein Q4C91_07025 [Eubacteriales bacterium]|nr:hypothetical protein [Eubacteriales bacterium]